MNRSDAWQRVVTWSAIVGYALVISGLPLPLGAVAPANDATAAAAKRLAAKDRSRPFPCMDKPCGCATAEQCFTNCCCNTPAETLAWARAHAVEPAVLAALERRVAAARPEKTVSCCCAPKATPEASCPVIAPAAEAAAESLPRRTVVLRAMLACGGVVAQWLACGASLPPPLPVSSKRVMIVIASVEMTDLLPCAVHAAPDVPPPRAA